MSNNKKNKFYGVNDDLWGHKWGFKDSSFIINDDNTVTFTGKRYEGISGERLPYLIPFVTKVLKTDIKDRTVIFGAQFSLSHACWLIAYPLIGYLLVFFGLKASFMIIFSIVLVATLTAWFLWYRPKGKLYL